jgi:hypothetical protein
LSSIRWSQVLALKATTDSFILHEDDTMVIQFDLSDVVKAAYIGATVYLVLPRKSPFPGQYACHGITLPEARLARHTARTIEKYQSRQDRPKSLLKRLSSGFKLSSKSRSVDNLSQRGTIIPDDYAEDEGESPYDLLTVAGLTETLVAEDDEDEDNVIHVDMEADPNACPGHRVGTNLGKFSKLALGDLSQSLQSLPSAVDAYEPSAFDVCLTDQSADTGGEMRRILSFAAMMDSSPLDTMDPSPSASQANSDDEDFGFINLDDGLYGDNDVFGFDLPKEGDQGRDRAPTLTASESSSSLFRDRASTLRNEADDDVRGRSGTIVAGSPSVGSGRVKAKQPVRIQFENMPLTPTRPSCFVSMPDY